MSNVRNNYQIIGRLTREPVFFENSDGSKTVKITVAAQDNFKSGEAGEYASQFIPLESFIQAGAEKTVFDYMHKGDLVSCGCSLRSNVYEKDGETVFGPITVRIERGEVALLSTKAESAAHAPAEA